MSRLIIAAALLDEIRAAARRADPNECCGLIEGVAEGEGWRALAIHEARNVAADRKKNFLIDPEVLLRLFRTLRDTDREVIGCFHSHPSGLPSPSETDRREAVDDNFVWLVVRGDDVRAFAFDAGARAFRDVDMIDV